MGKDLEGSGLGLIDVLPGSHEQLHIEYPADSQTEHLPNAVLQTVSVTVRSVRCSTSLHNARGPCYDGMARLHVTQQGRFSWLRLGGGLTTPYIKITLS
jgi:hypothetical protein